MLPNATMTAVVNMQRHSAITLLATSFHKPLDPLPRLLATEPVVSIQCHIGIFTAVCKLIKLTTCHHVTLAYYSKQLLKRRHVYSNMLSIQAYKRPVSTPAAFGPIQFRVDFKAKFITSKIVR